MSIISLPTKLILGKSLRKRLYKRIKILLLNAGIVIGSMSITIINLLKWIVF